MQSDTATGLQGVGALLKGTWEVFKRRVWTLLSILIVGILLIGIPCAALYGLGLLAPRLPPAYKNALIIASASFGAVLIIFNFFWFQLAFLHAIADDSIGLKEPFRRAKTKFFSFLWLILLMVFILGGAYLLFLIPGVIFTISLFFAPFILVAEDIKGLTAIAKSRHYVRGHWFSVFWRVFAVTLISTIISVIPLLGQFLSLLLIPFNIIYYFLIYQDLQAVKKDVLFSPTGNAGVILTSLCGLLLIPGTLTFLVLTGKAKPPSISWSVPSLGIFGGSQPRISSVYPYLLTWGAEGTGEGQFKKPNSIAVDNGGWVYVGDTDNNRIQVFEGKGKFVAKWEFVHFISGLAVDGERNVYVTDGGFGRVKKYRFSWNLGKAELVREWGGRGTEDGQFGWPNGIAVDKAGHVYVVDTHNGRIQKFDSNGNFLMKWGSQGAEDGQFDWPYDVDIDNQGNIYVTDTNNHRIQKFDSKGNFLKKWGSSGMGHGQFQQPYSLAVDSRGNVYVGDFGNYNVQKFDTDGNFMAVWEMKDPREWKTEGRPYGIAVFRQSESAIEPIYIVDNANKRIDRLDKPILGEDSPLHGAEAELNLSHEKQQKEGAMDISLDRDKVIGEQIDRLGKESFPEDTEVVWKVLHTTHHGEFSLVEAEAIPATVGYPKFKFVLHFKSPTEVIVAGCYIPRGNDWALLFSDPKSPQDWKAIPAR